MQHVLIVKVYFERKKIAKVFMTHVQDFFRKSLSKVAFERKLSSVSLPLRYRDVQETVKRTVHVYQCVQVASRNQRSHRQQTIRQRDGDENNTARCDDRRHFRHKLRLHHLQYTASYTRRIKQ